jgi:4'-phosphopantetheinyl transferase
LQMNKASYDAPERFYSLYEDQSFMRSFKNPSKLKRGRIDIWFVNIDRLASDLQDFETALSPEEMTRAQRFLSSRDRNRYVVQHGVLRKLLAGYVGCDPCQVDIRSNENGKPYLAGPKNDILIQYSISHSEDFAAYAFGLIDSIGVDIEKIREFPDMLDVVEEHFTQQETHEIFSCPNDQRLKLFYRFWTRKEAVLKAQGEGLLRALDSVDVAFGKIPGTWKVRFTDRTITEEYFLVDIEAPSGFYTALAAAGSAADIVVSVNYAYFEKVERKKKGGGSYG